MNWDARPKGANYWERGWLKPLTSNDMPRNAIGCRAYDLASTERSQANRYPDPTACIQMFKCKQGYYYIAGNYHENFYDDMYDVYGQFCKRSGDRDNHILMQSYFDGEGITIVLPVDAGAAGRTAFEAMATNFTQHGFKVCADPMPTNKSKLVKFQPFATACEQGLVYILTDTFDIKTLEFIYKQVEAFNGERSTSQRHDEFPDVLGSAFNFISRAKVYNTEALASALSHNTNSTTNQTLLAQQRSTHQIKPDTGGMSKYRSELGMNKGKMSNPWGRG